METQTNDIRVAEKRNEVRSMLLSSIDALTRRLAYVEQTIEDFINGCEDTTMVKAVRANQLRRETGDDSLITRIGLCVLVNRADEPGADLCALRDSLESRLSALNNTLAKYEPIVYVAPVQAETAPLVARIPSPSEWADQQAERRMKREAAGETMTPEQQEKFEAALKEHREQAAFREGREGRTDVDDDNVSVAPFQEADLRDIHWSVREI